MLIEELNIAIIYPFGNFFPDLMRSTTFDHIQPCPSVLRLST